MIALIEAWYDFCDTDEADELNGEEWRMLVYYFDQMILNFPTKLDAKYSNRSVTP